jgi:hypothetical protein
MEEILIPTTSENAPLLPVHFFVQNSSSIHYNRWIFIRSSMLLHVVYLRFEDSLHCDHFRHKVTQEISTDRETGMK